MTEEPASARSTGTRRRTRRTGTRSTTTRRRTTSARRRVGGTELVSNLNQMVDQLIKENIHISFLQDQQGLENLL